MGGLRGAEVVALDLADYDPETGALAVRAGKGRTARLAYPTGSGHDAMSDWLARRAEGGAGSGAGGDAGSAAGGPCPLFLPIDKAGTIAGRRLTDQAVLDILRRRGRAAGVTPFSPHDLRRSFVSDLLDAGADIATVQGLAGHANVQTTARSGTRVRVRRGEVTKRQAAGRDGGGCFHSAAV